MSLSNIYSVFEPKLKKQPDKIAIKYFRKDYIEKITFAELINKIDYACEQLEKMGVKEGDRIGLIVETSPNWIIAFLAMMRMNLTAVLIDPTLPMDDIKNQVLFIGVRAVLLSEQTKNSEIYPALNGIPQIMVSNFELIDPNVKPQDLPESENKDSNIAIIIFTSGTSGTFKAVMLSHDNFLHVAKCKEIAAMIDETFSIFPCYHIAGITTCCQVTLYGGETLNLVEKIDPDLILRVFKETKPRIFLGVPRFLEVFRHKILSKINEQPFIKRNLAKFLIKLSGFLKKHFGLNPGKKLFKSAHEIFGGNLESIFTGGAPLDPKDRIFFESLGFSVFLAYGLSETSGIVVITDMQYKDFNALGRPLEGVELKIYEPDDKGVGEICIKSPSVMEGYYMNKEDTEIAVRDGWFHSGDLGYIGKNDNLTITGRLKELIVTASGKKATPFEIEKHYKKIPGVEELVVVGVLNPKLNCDEVYGIVIVDEQQINADVSKEQIQENIRSEIAKRGGGLPTQFRIQHIEFFDELPRTTGMKKLIRAKIVKKINERKSNKVETEVKEEPKENLRHNKVLDTIIAAISKVTSLPKKEIDPAKHFSDYGIDSLRALEIIQNLRDLLKDNTVLTEGLFKNPTIQEFAEQIIKTKNTPAEKNITTSSNLVPERKIPTSAPLAIKQEKMPDFKTIFITGGTGVLGGYLVKLLLSESNKTLYILTRAKTQELARKNFTDILEIYDTPKEMIEQYLEKVHFVLGDVSLPLLGIKEQEYHKLVAQVDAVIHAAGIVSLHGLYDALVPVNVFGTKQMIDFTLQTKNKYMVYISSYSILGDIILSQNPPFSEEDFDRGQGFKNMGYQQTKFEGELLVRESTEKGLKWNIIRPGDIFGDSNTGSYPLLLPHLTGIFYDILRTVIYTEVAVTSDVYFDMTPVDYVARGVIHLGFEYPAYYGTYHLTNPSHHTYTQVIKILKELGYKINLISFDEYMPLLRDKKLLYKGQPYSSRTLELLQFNPLMAAVNESTKITTDITTEILDKVNINCPDIDEKLLKTYLDYCKKVGYIVT